MTSEPTNELYSPREIAMAAGAAEEQAVALVGRADALVSYSEAVRLGRILRRRQAAAARPPGPLFWTVSGRATGARARAGVPLAVSSTLHAGLIAAVLFLTTLGLSPRAATVAPDRPAGPMRLVFLARPGPGGGGGGGGVHQPAPPPKAERRGARAMSSPLPRREMPKTIAPSPAPPEPKPQPIRAEQLPVLVAPIVPSPADTRDRTGVLTESRARQESRGPGSDGGTGSGAGTGVGEGQGAGVGGGSGGGTGGGPYRPGSGIEPPRLLREVKADYTEDARRRGVEGDVVLEIVVRRDGSVGDVRLLQGLGSGLNERAVDAVRQWRFTPARRLNAPVDVIVEVSVEFKLR